MKAYPFLLYDLRALFHVRSSRGFTSELYKHELKCASLDRAVNASTSVPKEMWSFTFNNFHQLGKTKHQPDVKFILKSEAAEQRDRRIIILTMLKTFACHPHFGSADSACLCNQTLWTLDVAGCLAKGTLLRKALGNTHTLFIFVVHYYSVTNFCFNYYSVHEDLVASLA